jgi:hypothetical protein
LSWKDGDFSNELLNDVKIELAIGKIIECEDGISRMVHEIVGSYVYPWRVVINEKDPDSKSGYFVNLLSLCHQILGYPAPSREAQESFVKGMRLKYSINEDGSFDRPPLFTGKKFFA